jgi:hypothetical protein
MVPRHSAVATLFIALAVCTSNGYGDNGDELEPTAQALADDGLFSNTVRDVFAIVGVIGVVVTITALFLTLHQIRQAVSVTEATSKAAINTINENRDRFNRHLTTQSLSLCPVIIDHIRNDQFAMASTRLAELARLLRQVIDDKAVWYDLASQLDTTDEQFGRIAAGVIRCSEGMRKKSRRLIAEVQTTRI